MLWEAWLSAPPALQRDGYSPQLLHAKGKSPFERQIPSPSSHQALSLYMLLIIARDFAFARGRSSGGLQGAKRGWLTRE